MTKLDELIKQLQSDPQTKEALGDLLDELISARAAMNDPSDESEADEIAGNLLQKYLEGAMGTIVESDEKVEADAEYIEKTAEAVRVEPTLKSPVAVTSVRTPLTIVASFRAGLLSKLSSGTQTVPVKLPPVTDEPDFNITVPLNEPPEIRPPDSTVTTRGSKKPPAKVPPVISPFTFTVET